MIKNHISSQYVSHESKNIFLPYPSGTIPWKELTGKNIIRVEQVVHDLTYSPVYGKVQEVLPHLNDIH